MRDFDDVVCELHALKWHGLSPHICAWAVNKSLEDTKEHSFKVEGEGKTKCQRATDYLLDFGR